MALNEWEIVRYLLLLTNYLIRCYNTIVLVGGSYDATLYLVRKGMFMKIRRIRLNLKWMLIVYSVLAIVFAVLMTIDISASNPPPAKNAQIFEVCMFIFLGLLALMGELLLTLIVLSLQVWIRKIRIAFKRGAHHLCW